MRIVNQINKDTRIVLKLSSKAIDYAFCLQRRKYRIWRTVSWIYPSIAADMDCQKIYNFLFWDEQERKLKKLEKKSQKKIGLDILDKCKSFNPNIANSK